MKRVGAGVAGWVQAPRRRWPGLLFGGLLLAAAWLMLRPAWWQPPPAAAPPATWPGPSMPAAPATAAPAQPAPLALPAALQAVPRAPGAAAAAAAPAVPPPALPYRYIGRLARDAGSALVLFGQGRVVILDGPGPLDELHVVEAVLDGALLVRHLPSGRGLLLPQDARPPAAWTVHDPETLARD